MPNIKCRIAELNVLISTENATLLRQAEKYRFDFSGEPDIPVCIPEDMLENQLVKNNLSREVGEYLLTGDLFYRRLLKFDGFVMHASAIAYDRKAYLFSAPCGTGKSTHAGLWRKYLGEDKVVSINDDKPAIRKVDGVFYAYGTPWSGKTDTSANIKVPLGGIVYLSRAQTPSIRRTDVVDGVKNLLWQTARPATAKGMDKILNLFEELLNSVPIWEMGCNISEQSFRLSMETLTGEQKTNGK
ncbi:MAG: hypothetical protein IJW78_03680 [Clostridia bacterium]|nr:hypothetical protein [Clostridia bacterium]